MNIFNDLFGIFRQRGLVTKVIEGRSLTGFILSALLFSAISGLLYGFSMGIGLGVDTAVKDAIKVGLIVTLAALFSIPVFLVAYRLLGREEAPSQVTSVPLTLIATTAVLMAVTAPIVFMLSILAGFSPDAVYIHIVIIDVALLVGLYLAGTLLYHGLPDHRRLVIPNVVGFLILFVILVVLISFLSPFLEPSSSFSVGTDRFKDRLGMGVESKAQAALAAALAADMVSYRFQTTNENSDLTRDFSITRLGDNYLIEVHSYNLSGEISQVNRKIWVIDGKIYTDFNQGRVIQADREDLRNFLDPALPPAVFTLPDEFAVTNWRALDTPSGHTLTGIDPNQHQVVITLDRGTGRVTSLVLGSASRGVHAETRVIELSAATLDQSSLQSSLNQATILGNIDRSDATMKDYVQEDTYFALRYPSSWQSGSWSGKQQQVSFTQPCSVNEICPHLLVRVYELKQSFGAQQYADELAKSLGLQPEYREIKVNTVRLADQDVGVVEYLSDRLSKGTLVTDQHVEYIFVGQVSRYHLDFSASQANFESYRLLFEDIAGKFKYLVENAG